MLKEAKFSASKDVEAVRIFNECCDTANKLSMFLCANENGAFVVSNNLGVTIFFTKNISEVDAFFQGVYNAKS